MMFFKRNTNHYINKKEKTFPSIVSDKMQMAYTRWNEMYKSAEGLNLPYAVCSELARLAMLELKCTVSGGKRAEIINSAIPSMLENIRRGMDRAVAKGGMVLKPTVENGRISVGTVDIDKFIPTAKDSDGNIIGAVFFSVSENDGKFFTLVEEHRLSGGHYKICNSAYVSNIKGEIGKRIPLSEVPYWADLAEVTELDGILHPLFAHFKMPFANNVDPDSPLGASAFSGAENLIADANKQYDRLLWEFESGERALVVNEMALKRDKLGRPVLPDKRLYRTLDVTDDNLFEEWSPTFREQSIINGLDRILRQIEFSTGLAYGTLSSVENSDKTAEEIRMSKQRSYATVCDIQNALRKCIEHTIWIMSVWCDIYKLAPKGECALQMEFDDSIVADRKTEFDEKIRMVEAGIMTNEEFRKWYF